MSECLCRCKEVKIKINDIMTKVLQQYDILISSGKHEIDWEIIIKSIVKNIISEDKKIIDIHGNVRP